MASLEEVSSKLLDFSTPTDVPLLEATVGLLYSASSLEQQKAAERLLQQFQENPQAWTRVDSILETCHAEQTKFFALQILESVIKFKWGALPVEQREGMKNYVSNLIIKYSTDEALIRTQTTFLNKLNVILVHILKQDWPHRWPSFIPDLVAASRTSETLCENSMVILKLLSEEIFDFSRGELTQAKTRALKNTLNNEFRLIHELCTFVLVNTQKPQLVRATLQALHAYLSWVPLGYIFESNLIELLLNLFPQPAYRNVALQCLTEVGSLAIGSEFDSHFEKFYLVFMSQLQALLPPGTNLQAAYTNGTDEQQAFVQDLALFFTGFFKEHISMLERGPDTLAALLVGLDYLVGISYVDDTEVFKTCLDYWNLLVPDIYASVCQSSVPPTDDLPFSFSVVAPVQPPRSVMRRQHFDLLLKKLRLVMVAKMAKPEEVIVVEDENGNVVRETLKDNDVLAQYRSMRETLIYLCHLDYDDTEMQMLDKLRVQMQAAQQLPPGHRMDWGALNTLCWAIGSVSGAMQEDQENKFLVTVIRDLLNLCELSRGKDNKAIIASNIMYVVGQYPKFLRAHWKFLKTVVNKLFEFMHETHPGVQDMACDTFIKICNKCKRKFVVLQIGEREPFISELLSGLNEIIHDLQPHQVCSFYESVALMIGAESDQPKKEEYLVRLMTPPNGSWRVILTQALQNPDALRQAEAIKTIQNVLQTNLSVCSALGHPFITQMNAIFPDMLQVYKLYSEMISLTIKEGGPHAARSSQVKYMRSVKKVVLKLIETFVEKCEDLEVIATQYVPAMMDPILGDYQRSVPDARDAEVLSLFAVIIDRLKYLMEPEVPRIFEAVFEVTLQMITQNMEDYPEHRLRFFALLHAITNHCFKTLFIMSPQQLKLVIDSIVWAFRHTERNVAETGLTLLQDMLISFTGSEFATQFYQAYYLQLVREILAVMTDTFHKPGFKLQARILHHLFNMALSTIQAPLWEVGVKGPSAYPSNVEYVQEFTAALLAESFQNLSPTQVQACVLGMLDLKEFGPFKHHLRDFLAQTKQFASTDNTELFADEVEAQRQEARKRMAVIPGMIPQSELPNEMEDGS